MPTINQLPTLDTLEPSNQVPTYSVENGDARKFSLSTLTEYLEQTMDLPDNADEITYTPAGTGAVSRTVQAKLRDVVSVKDFGAVGDGVADDTVAIQAAFNTGKVVMGAAGETYKITSTLTATGLKFNGNGCTINVHGNVNGISLVGSSAASLSCNLSNFLIANQGSPLSATNSAIVGDVQGVFENIYARYFNVGFDFTDVSFLLTINNSTAYNCIIGFKNRSDTTSATTTVFDRCYALACGTGFFLYGIADGEMRNCAIDIGPGDYAVPCNTAVYGNFLGGWNISATHIEGNPNPSGVYFNCFDFENIAGAINILGTNFDIYQNAITTRLFYLSGYSTPFGRVNIIGNRQVPKGTMPFIIRYSLRTDNAAYKLYVYAYNNSFIATNCTVRLGNEGAGNVGESWIAEANTLEQIPKLYKLTGTSSGVVQTYPFGDTVNERIGLATDAPLRKLHIGSGTLTGPLLAFAPSVSTTDGTGIIWERDTDAFANAKIYCNYSFNYGGNIVIATSPTGGSPTAPVDRFIIKSAGAVNFVGLASAPAAPTAGDVYYDTGTNKLRCYNGTTWNDLF